MSCSFYRNRELFLMFLTDTGKNSGYYFTPLGNIPSDRLRIFVIEFGFRHTENTLFYSARSSFDWLAVSSYHSCF